ncbi:NAD(P)/FAD-dependent oxidoreductase [Ulvibacterium sp.]|uniref:NAD(P)/FAD-dependent oxidoreductase n=1 Tax=Ulvibacterium sp. TaxID=2665914 RepID=UPI003BAD6457
MEYFDVIIVGGGLAGLTAALHLEQYGHAVLVCEKQQYPHHKVCGEYVSAEVVPYLKKLGISLDTTNTVSIDTLQLSTVSGKSIKGKLPLGGKGISRYALDNLLYEAALERNIPFVFGNVTAIQFADDLFQVRTASGDTFSAKMVIGAYGKRSNLDKHLDRPFFRKKSRWLGIKAHYAYQDFPDNLVALHTFEGGYGGLSRTETGAVNFCYLVSYSSFRRENDVHRFNENVVAKNPFLGAFLEDAEPLFKEPLAIAQVSFEKKETVKEHVIMCGDTAGLIHPLCGNGMAMAIHSAKLASEQIHLYLTDSTFDRGIMEKRYTALWKNNFGYRLWMGRQLQSLLINRELSHIALGLATRSPRLLRYLIKQTHGKPIL